MAQGITVIIRHENGFTSEISGEDVTSTRQYVDHQIMIRLEDVELVLKDSQVAQRFDYRDVSHPMQRIVVKDQNGVRVFEMDVDKCDKDVRVQDVLERVVSQPEHLLLS